MKTVCINVRGSDCLIRFEYHAEDFDNPACIEIDEVMSQGVVRAMPEAFLTEAAREIMAQYGDRLRDDAAEVYAIEQYDKAYR